MATHEVGLLKFTADEIVQQNWELTAAQAEELIEYLYERFGRPTRDMIVNRALLDAAADRFIDDGGVKAAML